jgi:hypothetical protein
MIKSKNVKYVIDLSEYFLTFLNLIIALRLVILSIDIDNFRDTVSGKLTPIGNNIKFSQMLITNITNPIIKPFKSILLSFSSGSDEGLISILSPAFTIMFLLILMALVKVLTPVIMDYAERIGRDR